MSIDNIFICVRDADLDEVRYPLCSHAREALLELLESCKPEQRVATMVIGCPHCHRNFPTNEEQYNVGVNEYHSNIRKLFEVKE